MILFKKKFEIITSIDLNELCYKYSIQKFLFISRNLNLKICKVNKKRNKNKEYYL